MKKRDKMKEQCLEDEKLNQVSGGGVIYNSTSDETDAGDKTSTDTAGIGGGDRTPNAMMVRI